MKNAGNACTAARSVNNADVLLLCDDQYFHLLCVDRNTLKVVVLDVRHLVCVFRDKNCTTLLCCMQCTQNKQLM
jgi:hypothetical protein